MCFASDGTGRISDEQSRLTFNVNVIGSYLVADEACAIWARQDLRGSLVLTTSGNTVVSRFCETLPLIRGSKLRGYVSVGRTDMPAKPQTLEDAFVEEIRDLYDAEKQLIKALPKMAKAAHAEELRDAFREHLEVTKTQAQRLEQIFEMLGQKARSKPCKGMKGLIEEGQELIEEDSGAEEHIADLDLIAAAQKVEHYEISGYGTARTFAQAIGQKDAAQLLDETAKEEGETDKKLTQLARSLYKQAYRAERSGGSYAGNGRSRSTGDGSSRGRRSRMEEEEEVEV